jgi:Fur family ferric uptake transcriptional regulator
VVSDPQKRHATSEARAERDSVREDIRFLGLRATPARVATLLLLRGSGSPLTHAEVAEDLEDQGFDRATLFRNLNDLAEAGLLRRTELGDHVWRFEVRDATANDDATHPHFVCVDCGSVTCLDQVQLTAGSRRQSEGVGKVTEILLRGHCHECQ